MSEPRYKDSDINEWPHSWKCIREDIQYGEEIIKLFKLYIEDLKKEALTRKTINRHISHLWVLGGWLITQLNYDPEERDIKPHIHFLENIAGLDGPLIHDFNEAEHSAFDASCRKFYKWLVSNGYEKSEKSL